MSLVISFKVKVFQGFDRIIQVTSIYELGGVFCFFN